MSFNEVIVKGGLGNQLFCLFYAYRIFLTNKTVSLNILNYSLSKRKDRDFVLESFFPLITNIFKINNTKKSLLLLLYSKIFEKFFVKSNLNRLPGDEIFIIQFWPNCYIHSGYYQKIGDSKFDKKSLNLFKSYLAPYISGIKNNFLAIHIRRGDYLNSKHSMHGIISECSLLKESKKQILNVDYDGITIFSDSPELVDLNSFKSLHKNVVFDIGGDPVEVFKRMSNHKGLVASNSSFSLWAGILGGIKYFSIPEFWMKNVKSSIIGLDFIRRYECYIK